MADLFCPTISSEIETKFWTRVDKSNGQGPNGDCWCWTAGLMPKPCDYPKGFSLKTDGKWQMYRSSHVALAISGCFRPSAAYQALHSCDHKPCVRPSHLRWGTVQENRQDHFERTKRAMFTNEQIREIRASDVRIYLIARQYGVTDSCIHNIKSRTSYRHVE